MVLVKELSVKDMLKSVLVMFVTAVSVGFILNALLPLIGIT